MILRSLESQPSLSYILSNFPGPLVDYNVMPSDVKDAVKQLERSRVCELSGTSGGNHGDLTVEWIFLPSEAFRLPENLSFNFDPSPYVVPQNAIYLHRNLVKPLTDNTIGVDDDFRIVRFVGDLDLQGLSLPSHVSQAQTQRFDTAMKEFLRQHFVWCLRVHICGGDVLEDFKEEDIIETMRELGFRVGSDDEEVETPPLDDPLWQTEIGKVCWEMRVRSSLAGYR
ncbi:hypothetical protein SISSUDRAFT_417720 [Sistotremastrum suecicum HHB10207 ss-3]|uniref:Uncharacterized protein n=1 Tax=Sistotremastrum suecicum HHB10207 ss-3 TaxID=1314776 RepID=A0A166FR01_9AGAM|nr:hypothetical protein SISSUDRAFT_417720 [Sistotremastrum suecicum HHB10207 ss-3]